jgi:hypothetical protein
MANASGESIGFVRATEAAGLTVSATARVISNFAWQHMKAASIFRDHVVRLEIKHRDESFSSFFEEIRSYGSGCIMSVAASIEALINELFITPEGPLRRQIADFESEFWGRNGIEFKQPLEKYQLALSMLGKPKFDTSVAPYKDAWVLVELRNALVHYKPTWDPDRQRKVEMVELLGGKYQTSPFVDAGADFVTMKSMCSGCMNWAIATAVAFLREFQSRTSLDPHKMGAFWQFERRG